MSKFNKKIKITYNKIDDNMDIDSVFREMDKVFSKYNSSYEDFAENAEKYMSGKSNISVQIIDENKKEPKKMSFKKWMAWVNS